MPPVWDRAAADDVRVHQSGARGVLPGYAFGVVAGTGKPTAASTAFAIRRAIDCQIIWDMSHRTIAAKSRKKAFQGRTVAVRRAADRVRLNELVACGFTPPQAAFIRGDNRSAWVGLSMFEFSQKKDFTAAARTQEVLIGEYPPAVVPTAAEIAAFGRPARVTGGRGPASVLRRATRLAATGSSSRERRCLPVPAWLRRSGCVR